MELETLLLSVEDSIAQIAINRPDKLNALNQTVRREIKEVVDHLATRDDVKVAILTGSGDKAFVVETYGAQIYPEFAPLNGGFAFESGQSESSLADVRLHRRRVNPRFYSQRAIELAGEDGLQIHGHRAGDFIR